MSQPVPIVIVNEQDEPVGSASIHEAQATGLIHRIVRVMVDDTNGNILLQQRNLNAELYPGRWDNSAAGHVDSGESYETAASRELAEEIGLSDVELKEVGYYRHIGRFENRLLNRFTKVYKVTVPKTTTFTMQPEEVVAIKWVSLQELKQLAAETPEQVTDGIIEVLKRFYP